MTAIKRLVQKTNSQRLVLYTSLASIFIIPAGNAVSNFNFQLVVILLAGLLSWALLFTMGHDQLSKLRSMPLLLILISALAVIAFSHSKLNLWGKFYDPVGAVIVLAYVGIAVAVSSLKRQEILKAIFLSSVLLAITSLIYPHTFYLGRLTGITFQPDILAAYLACGFLAGLISLFGRVSKKIMYASLAGELIIIVALCLTKTRVALFLAIVMALIYFIHERKKIPKNLQRLALFAIALIVCTALFSSRLNNLGNLTTSSSYRWSLQKVALKEFAQSPFSIEGNQGLNNYLSCGNFKSYSDIKATCDQGYIITSSHNVFLDRLIEFGIIGGIGYVSLVLWSLYRYLKEGGPVNLVAALILLTLTLYYLTNVTAITLELLIWLLVLSGWDEEVSEQELVTVRQAA